MAQGAEYYTPQPAAANSLFVHNGMHIAAFLATVAGTITITDISSGNVILNALPVAVGFNRLAILYSTSSGAKIQLAGGAAGTLLF